MVQIVVQDAVKGQTTLISKGSVPFCRGSEDARLNEAIQALLHYSIANTEHGSLLYGESAKVRQFAILNDSLICTLKIQHASSYFPRLPYKEI